MLNNKNVPEDPVENLNRLKHIRKHWADKLNNHLDVLIPRKEEKIKELENSIPLVEKDLAEARSEIILNKENSNNRIKALNTVRVLVKVVSSKKEIIKRFKLDLDKLYTTVKKLRGQINHIDKDSIPFAEFVIEELKKERRHG